MSAATRVSLFLLLALAGAARAEAPAPLLARFDAFPHAVRIEFSDAPVVDYEIGLGAIQKRGGAWQLKHSERMSGRLVRYTWQITDGYDASGVLAEMEAALGGDGRLLFGCDGRECGQGVQWANRVFHQRLLYGRDELQRYRVYGAPGGAADYRLILFSAARTADRQYLHAELLVPEGK